MDNQQCYTYVTRGSERVNDKKFFEGMKNHRFYTHCTVYFSK